MALREMRAFASDRVVNSIKTTFPARPVLVTLIPPAAGALAASAASAASSLHQTDLCTHSGRDAHVSITSLCTGCDDSFVRTTWSASIGSDFRMTSAERSQPLTRSCACSCAIRTIPRQPAPLEKQRGLGVQQKSAVSALSMIYQSQ